MVCLLCVVRKKVDSMRDRISKLVLQVVLLLSAAISTATFAHAQSAPPNWFATIEGGLAAANRVNQQVPSNIWSSTDQVAPLGKAGRLGIGQTNATFGPFDYWGVFGSHSDIRHRDTEDFIYSCNGSKSSADPCIYGVNGWGSSARRSTLDLELGSTLARGPALFEANPKALNSPSHLRALIGVRGTIYEQNVTLNQSPQPDPFLSPAFVPSNHLFRAKFTGTGPRVGADAKVALTDTFAFTTAASVAALYGTHRAANTGDIFGSGTIPAPIYDYSFGNNGWVTNLEASAALAFSPFGSNGATFSIGARYDAWLGQRNLNAWSGPVVAGNRTYVFSWDTQNKSVRTLEPFLRVDVPLGGKN
jgi:hypothetical protein